MADQKANFLLAASFVTLSILIGYGTKHQVTGSLLSVGFFTVSASICAILAIMPRYRSDGHSRGSAAMMPVNPLFFGDFAGEDLDTYLATIKPILDSDMAIYEAMIRDIHALGKVLLEKKFRYLSWSYRIFLGGLFVSPLLWIIEQLS